MKMVMILATAGLSLTLAACGESDTTAANSGPTQANGPAQASAGSAPASSSQAHSGAGNVTEVSADSVTISHGPVQSLGWPAMTMPFSAAGSPDLLRGINVGDPVIFEFRQDGGRYVLTSISKQ